MLKIVVERPTKKSVRVAVTGDEGMAVRSEMLDKLQELFGQGAIRRNHRSFTVVFASEEAANKTAKTIEALWGGELLRGVDEGESHVKKLVWEAVTAFRAEFPNTVRINKISPVQVVIENVACTAVLTLDGYGIVTGEYDLKTTGMHVVGEFIDGAWSWHIDATGRTA